jgi:hypothetical protein
MKNFIKKLSATVLVLVMPVCSHANDQIILLQCQGKYERYYPFRASPQCGTFSVSINSSSVIIDGLCDISKRITISEMTRSYVIFNQGELLWASINRLSGEMKYTENRRLGGGQLGINVEFHGFCKTQKPLF